MGCTASSNFHQILSKTVFESLVPDSDWDAFECLWKQETLMVSKVPALAGRAYLLIVSGEINATLTNQSFTKSKPAAVLGKVFREGDVVNLMHSRHSAQAAASEGSLTFGEIKLSFAAEGQAAVATLNDSDLEEFLRQRPHLSHLYSVHHFNITGDCDSFEFKGIGSNQIAALATLSLLKHIDPGTLLTESSRGAMSPKKTSNFDNYGYRTNEAAGLVIHGQVFLVDSNIDPHFLLERVGVGVLAQQVSKRNAPIKSSSKTQSRKLSVFSPQPSKVETNKIHVGTNIGSMVTSEDGLALRPGSVFGMEQALLPKPIPMDNVLCLESAYILQLDSQAIEAFRQVDTNFVLKLQTNYIEAMIDSVCKAVPIFSDLDSGDMHALATKAKVMTFSGGTTVYKQGDPADHFFVIMRGTVEELIKTNTENSTEFSMEIGNTFYGGEYFGEVSLVTESPYPTTMTCIEPSIILSINDKTFRSIFTDNKAKLCDINIRLAGLNVELEYILLHPEGYKQFLGFLQREHSAENLLFWHAVDRFEEMCLLLVRELTVQKSAYIPATEEISEVKRHSSRSSGVASPDSNKTALRSHFNNLRAQVDVGRSILDKYIREGSPEQVNIPGKMRDDTEALFARWVAIVSAMEPSQLPSPGVSPKSTPRSQEEDHSDETDLSPLGSPTPKTTLQPVEIFKKAKKEIYDLLKKDSYVRWKQTSEFTEFIFQRKTQRQPSGREKTTRRSSIAAPTRKNPAML